MLSVTNLTYERWFEPVFAPVSFALAPGEGLLVTGPNGCGKTTLIRLLCGLLTPTEGAAELPFADTAYVGHALGIKNDLTVLENLRFAASLLGAAPPEADDIAATLGLAAVAHQSARSLSAGQRKRCALGRLLVADTRLWLLDEPYANLDAAGVTWLDGLIAAHLASGGSCVMATHGDHRPGPDGWRELPLQAGAVH